MFFFDCEQGFVADNGQNDVVDGSVENYDFNWDEETTASDTVTDNMVTPSDTSAATAPTDTTARPTGDSTGTTTGDTVTDGTRADTIESPNTNTNGITSAPSGNALNNTTTNDLFQGTVSNVPRDGAGAFPGTPSGNVVTGKQQP